MLREEDNDSKPTTTIYIILHDHINMFEQHTHDFHGSCIEHEREHKSATN